MMVSHQPSAAEDGAALTSPKYTTTPTLSPISENGREHVEDAPGIRSVGGTETGKEGTKDAMLISIENLPARNRDRRSSSGTKTLKLSPKQIQDLTASPESIPSRALDDEFSVPTYNEELRGRHDRSLPLDQVTGPQISIMSDVIATEAASGQCEDVTADYTSARPNATSRSMSSPLFQRKQSSSRSAKSKPQLAPLKTEDASSGRGGRPVKPSPKYDRQASPMPPALPLPPLSLPTYLHLELASHRPSPLYIHRSASADFPYESSKVKFERLLNFLLLPPNLEQVLWFGAIACLDAWLYTFTILPLRFFRALAILIRWLGRNALQEILDLGSYVYAGIGRMWQRSRQHAFIGVQRKSRSQAKPLHTSSKDEAQDTNGHPSSPSPARKPQKHSAGIRHRRTRSTPSALLPNHKADLLQGLLIIFSCALLMWLDASRMYHSIRGQAAIKLYVIYNVLEVFDRLFSAIGQDVLECLFSKETLERDDEGRSKIFRPLWMFLLALAYNVVHATALFYQVVTLNVAVNSYSNALLTLLMSNQFVEIKGTVFKKFEKENLFQLTCADVVERFQLWLMLLIIALRNIVEVGGLNISLSSAFSSSGSLSGSTSGINGTGIPIVSGFVIPQAFTLFPKWTGEVLGPFLIVLGSEALVDWCKHAYITKFNNVKPNIYGRFLDVLAKDYYTHAFADQNLTKRLGLPVIPLSCLFIRACMQTYHMFLATHMPATIPAISTSLSVESEVGASSTASLMDQVFRRALGRSAFGAGPHAVLRIGWWSIDDFIALATMIIFFLAIYLLLLAFKLLLGMSLLSFARRRYKGMKERERQSVDAQGRRVGGWGSVEVNEDKRRWIYDDDPDALRDLREKENTRRAKADKGEMKLDNVDRYTMAAKRIW